MKITRELAVRSTIEAFAERHGLEMVVIERKMDRWQRKNGLKPFYACFRHAELKEGGFLRSASGEGDTEAEAIRAYAREISSGHLVIGAYTPERRDIDVPRLDE